MGHLGRRQAVAEPEQGVVPCHQSNGLAKRAELDQALARHHAEQAGEQAGKRQRRTPVRLEVGVGSHAGVIHPVAVGVDQFEAGLRGEALGYLQQRIGGQAGMAGQPGHVRRGRAVERGIERGGEGGGRRRAVHADPRAGCERAGLGGDREERVVRQHEVQFPIGIDLPVERGHEIVQVARRAGAGVGKDTDGRSRGAQPVGVGAHHFLQRRRDPVVAQPLPVGRFLLEGQMREARGSPALEGAVRLEQGVADAADAAEADVLLPARAQQRGRGGEKTGPAELWIRQFLLIAAQLAEALHEHEVPAAVLQLGKDIQPRRIRHVLDQVHHAVETGGRGRRMLREHLHGVTARQADRHRVLHERIGHRGDTDHALLEVDQPAGDRQLAVLRVAAVRRGFQRAPERRARLDDELVGG